MDLLKQLDHTWTLFLDRDGVINERLIGAYVEHPLQFRFTKGCLEAMVCFNDLFGRILIVTNQQGIGRGMMTEAKLATVHRLMMNSIKEAGGRIDKVYYCPDLVKLTPNCRKPNPAMAFQAKNDFPEIDFTKSIMVGDSISDMEFGKRLGMTTVFIEEKTTEVLKEELIDFHFESLSGFSEYLNPL